MDVNLYDKCSRECREKTRNKEQERTIALDKWAKLEAAAISSGLTIT